VRQGALVALVFLLVVTGRLAEAETALQAAEEVAPQEPQHRVVEPLGIFHIGHVPNSR
jgi:hypothetical protein